MAPGHSSALYAASLFVYSVHHTPMMHRTLTAVAVAMLCAAHAHAQITVTSSVFPAVGDTLHYAFGNQPDAVFAIYTAPGGDQQWDLSGLQATEYWQQIFRAPSSGLGAADFPGAELMYRPYGSDPDRETYLSVSATQVTDMGSYGDEPIDASINITTHLQLPMPVQYAPMNFFDITQHSSYVDEAFTPDQMPPNTVSTLGVDSVRVIRNISRLDVVDAWGTLTIPGGSYPVLRQKHTLYDQRGLAAYAWLLGWFDITGTAVDNNWPINLGTDTIVWFDFVNDQSKEIIASCTLNNVQNNVIQVRYKVAGTPNTGMAGADTTITICSSAQPFQLLDALAGAPQAGGTWSHGGVPHSPLFVPGPDGPGVYCYAVSGDTACLTVIVNTAPNAGIDNAVSACENAPPFTLIDSLSGNPDPFGHWENGDPGVYFYIVDGSAPCANDTAVLQVTLVPSANAGIGDSITVCENATPFVMIDSLLGSPDVSGSWEDGAGVPHNGIFLPGTDAAGSYAYIVPGIAPCTNDSATLAITVLPPTDPQCLNTGVPAITGPILRLYPDPTTGLVLLSGYAPGLYTINVYDQAGRCAWRGTMRLHVSATQLELPASLPSGKYVIETRSDRGQVQRFPVTLMR